MVWKKMKTEEIMEIILFPFSSLSLSLKSISSSLFMPLIWSLLFFFLFLVFFLLTFFFSFSHTIFHHLSFVCVYILPSVFILLLPQPVCHCSFWLSLSLSLSLFVCLSSSPLTPIFFSLLGTMVCHTVTEGYHVYHFATFQFPVLVQRHHFQLSLS